MSTISLARQQEVNSCPCRKCTLQIVRPQAVKWKVESMSAWTRPAATTSATPQTALVSGDLSLEFGNHHCESAILEKKLMKRSPISGVDNSCALLILNRIIRRWFLPLLLQFRTFDPRSKAPLGFRGSYSSIDTIVPRIQICQVLPKKG